MKWREWPVTAWGYWDHTPVTIVLIMVIAVVTLPVGLVAYYSSRNT